MSQIENTQSVDASDDKQYTLIKILIIWVVVALPIPVLAFVVGPAMAPGDSWQAGTTIWALLIGGMIWQFVLSVGILVRELDTFS